MNAITLLKQDHKKVRGLFREFERAGHHTVQQKQKVADQTFNELETHTTLEEETFYPAVAGLKDGEAQDLVREAIEEHAVAKNLIADLKGLTPEDEAYDAKFKVLSENVEHHIEEEEGELFPHAERKFDETQLKDLGRRMADRKHALNAPSFLGETLQHAKEFVAQAYDAIIGNGPATKSPRRRARTLSRAAHVARVTPKKRPSKTGSVVRRNARNDGSARTTEAVRKVKRTMKTAARTAKGRTTAERTSANKSPRRRRGWSRRG